MKKAFSVVLMMACVVGLSGCPMIGPMKDVQGVWIGTNILNGYYFVQTLVIEGDKVSFWSGTQDGIPGLLVDGAKATHVEQSADGVDFETIETILEGTEYEQEVPSEFSCSLSGSMLMSLDYYYVGFGTRDWKNLRLQRLDRDHYAILTVKYMLDGEYESSESFYYAGGMLVDIGGLKYRGTGTFDRFEGEGIHDFETVWGTVSQDISMDGDKTVTVFFKS
jgi:hypothetical protein